MSQCRSGLRSVDQESTTSSVASSRFEGEWDSREETQRRELEEARARASQMEKTMRWWSDCTANWREKWSKVRAERNKAREEAKASRQRAESAIREAQAARRELAQAQGQQQGQVAAIRGQLAACREEIRQLREAAKKGGVAGIADEDNGLGEGAWPKSKVAGKEAGSVEEEETWPGDNGTALDPEAELDRLRLETRRLQVAREESIRLHKEEVESLRAELQEEAVTRATIDKRLQDLRGELEHLQAENAAEWGRRERLETEKAGLEREVRKLRGRLHDAPPIPAGVANESDERKRELQEVRQAHCKLKKVLQDKSRELAHSLRRSEQYEAEVRRLRGRVEELKRELACAEDELDSATSAIRRLQRDNQQLHENNQCLQAQLDQLNNRISKSSSGSALCKGTSTITSDILKDDASAGSNNEEEEGEKEVEETEEDNEY